MYTASERAYGAYMLAAKLLKLNCDKERIRKYIKVDEHRSKFVMDTTLALINWLTRHRLEALNNKYASRNLSERINMDLYHVKKV